MLFWCFLCRASVAYPSDVMPRIDAAVAARRIKTPRHTWLLEAVMEKLDREAGEGS
jgi:hypothetical protein